MRALTFIQPMGWAVVEGTKRIENRVRPLPAWMRDRRVLIAVHGGKSWDTEYANTVSRFCGFGYLSSKSVRMQGIIGAMILTGRMFTSLPEAQLAYTAPDVRWYSGPYGYEIEWAAALPEPIPCKGAMGWWRVDDRVARECWALVPAERAVGVIEETV